MKTLFQQYKPFLLFLTKFFLSYLGLMFLYGFVFLRSDDTIDNFTSLVAYLTEKTALVFGMDYRIEKGELEYLVFYQGEKIVRIIEGCNAAGVIILFVSFVLAFSGKLKSTILYCLGGGILIYILNIFRIVLLVVLIYKYPKEEHFLHGVLFPFIIYGIVFLLWLIWIKKYSKYVAK